MTGHDEGVGGGAGGGCGDGVAEVAIGEDRVDMPSSTDEIEIFVV